MDDRRPCDRREAVQRVAALLGGAVLAGGDRLFAFSFEPAQSSGRYARRRPFTAADVALLDEIAETSCSRRRRPAPAAKVGVHGVDGQRGTTSLPGVSAGSAATEEACRRRTPFVHAGVRRPAVVARGSARPRAVMEIVSLRRARAPAAPESDEPAHYFRLMKSSLLGYFTSEIGCTRMLRYVESPGRFDRARPIRPATSRGRPSDTSWRETPAIHGSTTHGASRLSVSGCTVDFTLTPSPGAVVGTHEDRQPPITVDKLHSKRSISSPSFRDEATTSWRRATSKRGVDGESWTV